MTSIQISLGFMCLLFWLIIVGQSNLCHSFLNMVIFGLENINNCYGQSAFTC